MEAASKKVIVAKAYNPDIEKKFINLNSVSANCPIMNLPRNDYNHLYLQANQLSGYMQQNIHRIRTYLRETTNLQLQTLQDFASCFLKCDKQRSGQITRRAFILKLAKNNTQAPQHLMNNILQDIQLNQREAPTDNTILVYKHLIDIIEIFQHCPAILPVDSNKSTNFIHSLERLPMLKTVETYGRTDLLLQHVNNRILEKHKGFTEAFRRFDKNFDGSLNFREFVQGMGEMGLNLTLTDMRLLFDKIDFDKEG
jgi:Ca2+-binding EF-hand superfamily protein